MTAKEMKKELLRQYPDFWKAAHQDRFKTVAPTESEKFHRAVLVGYANACYAVGIKNSELEKLRQF